MAVREDIALAPGPTFERDTLRRALEQLIDWRLVDRPLPPGTDGEPTSTLHPIYRAFVASSAIRDDWTTRLLLDDRVVMEAATRAHERLIALTIGKLDGDVGRYMTLFSQTVHDRTLARAIPDLLHVMRAQLRLGNLTRWASGRAPRGRWRSWPAAPRRGVPRTPSRFG